MTDEDPENETLRPLWFISYMAHGNYEQAKKYMKTDAEKGAYWSYVCPSYPYSCQCPTIHERD